MKTKFGELLESVNEGKVEEIHVDMYTSMTETDSFVTYRKDGKYPLDNDGRVFWYDSPVDSQSVEDIIDGKPNSRDKDLVLMEFVKPRAGGIFLCDANFAVVKRYRNISEVAKEMYELMDEEGYSSDDVYHSPRELNIDFQNEYPTKEELFDLM